MYTYALTFFWGRSKILNFNIFVVFQKKTYFWGMKKLLLLQNWTISFFFGGGGSTQFIFFLQGKVQNWNTYLGSPNFEYFGLCLNS